MKRVLAVCTIATLTFASGTAAVAAVSPSEAAATTTSRTSLTPDFNPAVQFHPVTFTAVVTSTDSSVTATPTGNVQFRVNHRDQADGLVAIDASGVASWTTSSLLVGAYSLTAVYAGDANFGSSTSAPVLQTIKAQLATATAITSSARPAVKGQSVTFTATVTPENQSLGVPTGSVAWRIDGVSVGTAMLDAGGVATFTTARLAPGAHAVVATYGGAVSLAASSRTLSLWVKRAATRTVVTLNSPVGRRATKTYRATVSARSPGAGVPNGGTVQFRIDGVKHGGLRHVRDGVATWKTTRVLSSGKHRIVAIYRGSRSYFGSRSATVIQKVR